MLRVSQVMTRLSICLYGHNTIGDALDLMKEKRVTGLPLLNEQGHLIGLVTKEQIVESMSPSFSLEQKAGSCMTSRFIPLKEEALVEDVWNLPFEIFPVLNSREEITGIVSKFRLGQAFFDFVQLRNQELEAVFDSAHNGILAINKQGIITSLNPAAEKPARSTREEAVGKFLTDVIVPTGLLEVVRTGIPEFGVRFQVGKRQYITNRSPIIKDGEVIGAVGVFQDVSELEFVLQELQSVKQLNDELKTIVESSDNGIIVCNVRGEIQRANPAAEHILGFSSGELKTKNLGDLMEKGSFTQNILQLVKEAKGRVSVLEQPHPDHTLVVSGNPVFEDDGEMGKIVINIRDVSELLKLREDLEKSKLLSEKYQSEIALMRTRVEPEAGFVARSSVMKNVLDLVFRVSQVSSPVVLIGERGTGKADIARLIHNQSERKAGPFYQINCGSTPDHLLESELFGGSAAQPQKAGLLAMAAGGTLLLEDLGGMPKALQLRLLQTMRAKGTAGMEPQARFIVATETTLRDLVDRGLLLEELFFYLNIVPIRIPALRERAEDLPSLLNALLAENNNRYGFDKELSPEAVRLLLAYSWPGNLREMGNLIERLAVTAAGRSISPEDVEAVLYRKEELPPKTVAVNGVVPLKAAIDDLEQQLVTMAMEQYGTTVKAAEALGVNQSTVVRKLQKIKGI